MRVFSSSIERLGGWRRYGVASIAGAASVLAMAPFFLWPVLFVTLPVLVWLIDGSCRPGNATSSQRSGEGTEAESSVSTMRRMVRRPAVRAGLVGWCFGFGYFVPGLFWIGEAFLVEADKFAVLLPFAVTLLPAGLALFWGAATALASRAWWPGMARIVVLAVALSIAEWLRGHVLTGFPWNVLGYALTWPLPFMQSAAVLGIYGLTLLAIPLFAGPLVLAADAGAGRIPRHWRVTGTLLAMATLAVLYIAGKWRLASPDAASAHPPVPVRIVQPSIPQREKWRPENQQRIFAEHLALSHRDASGRDDGAENLKLIVWPEAAMPFLPLGSPGVLAAIDRMLPDGATLLSGALRVEEAETGSAGTERARRRVYNSLMAFGGNARPVAVYDKIHLVPFGEYLPFQALLESIGLEQLTRLRGGFATGITPRPLLALPGLPSLGPLICYEVIFPGAIVQGRERPAALVNVTNDGWFGNTTGPRQHLHQARVRAVEEGLPILRAANNGISAIIDARGGIIARLDLDVVGSVDGLLPAARAPPPYALYGDLAFLVGLMACAGGLLGFRRGSRKRPASSTQPGARIASSSNSWHGAARRGKMPQAASWKRRPRLEWKPWLSLRGKRSGDENHVRR